MIGLHISTTRIYQEIKHEWLFRKCGELHVTLSYHKINYREVFFENEEVQVFVDGWIFNAESYGKQAAFVAKMYQKYSIGFIEHLEGQFNIFIYDRINSYSLYANDIFAFRKHFILSDFGGISTDLAFIYDHLQTINFNHSHIQKNLNQNRYIDIKETFVEGVELVKPRSIIDFLRHTIYPLDSFNEKYRISSGKISATFVAKEIEKNIKEVHENFPVFLQLSGGMDSRFLLENFKSLDVPVTALAYGNLASDEVGIAKEVARVTHTPLKEVEYLPADFVTHSSNYCFRTGGLDIFVQSAFNRVIEDLNSEDLSNQVFDTGIGLNTFLGGTQIPKQYDSTSHEFSNQVFDLSQNDIYTSFFRIFSQLALRQSFHRELIEDRYAMFSYKNYFLMRSIPKSLLENYKFYKELASVVVRRSRDVPVQATMKPFHEEAFASDRTRLKEREENSLTQFMDNKVYHPHNRYYSDFDMWLRLDENWDSLLKDSILRPDCYISKYIPYPEIREIVALHRSGEKQNMRLIIRLISTELFLKETVKFVNH